ncbi:GNAT family N-acetyltransferase [Lachnospiraceae bacterium]|nr:GNAT family N-acetyltransferase [Lachnospiraceae bacterium]
MDIEIRKAELRDIDLLMKWRMRVLHEVFAIPDNQPAKDLEKANRIYYQSALQAGGHIACFAYKENEIVGCGGICLYQEMPSPDNLSGQCAYLMNIYTCPEFRRHGVGETVVRWLVGQAAQRSITKIYLETSEPGKKLYGKTGFVDMPDMMKLQTVKSYSR